MATEIENLRARTETLNEDLKTEEQKEKSLHEDIEILEEKIVIRNLEKELDAKRESVRQLESRKKELQDEYSQPIQETKSDEEPKETSEFVVAPEPIVTAESVETEEQTAQKKHRFF